jgi:hypothetical protein
MLGGLGINFFKSEWSYAQFRVSEGGSLCAFSEDAQNLIVITPSGNYYVAEIPKTAGGECKEVLNK